MQDPPTPICRCFTLCRRLFQDPATNDWALVSLTHQVFVPQYPAVEHFAVFARWTNSHGSYTVEVQLRSVNGEVVWRHIANDPFKMDDPSQVWVVPLHRLDMTIPAPGKYEVVMLANGREVAGDFLQAHLIQGDRRDDQACGS